MNLFGFTTVLKDLENWQGRHDALICKDRTLAVGCGVHLATTIQLHSLATKQPSLGFDMISGEEQKDSSVAKNHARS